MINGESDRENDKKKRLINKCILLIILSKPDRERQISYDIAYMWNLKKIIQVNLHTKQK